MTDEPKVPRVGVIIVGDDLEVCGAVAGIVRAAFVQHGVGSNTVSMENLTDQESFVNFSDYRDPEDAADAAESVWDKMCVARPELFEMVIPIEVLPGTAFAKTVTSDQAAIMTSDLRIASTVDWSLPVSKKD